MLNNNKMYEANYINGEYHVFPSNVNSRGKCTLNDIANDYNKDKNLFRKVYNEKRKKQRVDIKHGYNREYPELFKSDCNSLENPITKKEKTDINILKEVNNDIKRQIISPNEATFRFLNHNCEKLNKKFINNTNSIICAHSNSLSEENNLDELGLLSNKKLRIFSNNSNPIYNASYMPDNAQQIRNINDFSIKESDEIDPLKVISYIKKPAMTYNPINNSYKVNTGSVFHKSRWSNYLEK